MGKNLIQLYFSKEDKEFYNWIVASAKKESLTLAAFSRNKLKHLFNQHKEADKTAH